MNLMSPQLIRNGSALSGLVMVLFVIAHLAGLIPAFLAPASFEAYASALHRSSFLPVVEIGLAATAVVHVGLTLSKTIANRSSGNHSRLSSRRQAPLAAMASRSKLAAGLVTLVFLVIHLEQLRWPRPADGGERAALQAVLDHPSSLLLYAAAAVALGLHLLHGAEAAHRSLGWLTPANGMILRQGGRLIAAVIGGGFLLISVGIAWGLAA